MSANASEQTRPPLRTVFCTRGGLFGALVLRRLLACERIEICAIVRSSRNFNATFGFLRGGLAYLRRSGIAYTLYLFCATTIADLLCAFTPLGRVPHRTRTGGPLVFTTRDLNNPEGLRFLRSCAPDLLISAFFDQRLQEPALAVPRCASVNIHPSLLPDFKGVDPVLQARLHNAECIGVTVHYMDPMLDTGDIIAQRIVPAAALQSVFATTALLFKEGADLLAAAVERIGAGETGTAQSRPGTYQSWPSRMELKRFRARDGRLLRVSDFVRF